MVDAMVLACSADLPLVLNRVELTLEAVRTKITAQPLP
jgi:hypothetical protein